MKKSIAKGVVLIIVTLIAAMIIAGCSKEPEKKATILSAELIPDEITTGATSELVLDAKNTGKTAVNVRFNITAEAPEKVNLEYPREMSYTLQPGETTGKKIVKVTATSDTVRTDYKIHVALNDNEGKAVYDEGNIILTVRK